MNGLPLQTQRVRAVIEMPIDLLAQVAGSFGDNQWFYFQQPVYPRIRIPGILRACLASIDFE